MTDTGHCWSLEEQLAGKVVIDCVTPLGFYAGRLRNAHQVEAMTANLISVNRRYKAHAGLRVSGVSRR
jgi:predicted dinucleotide-binding enzyme